MLQMIKVIKRSQKKKEGKGQQCSWELQKCIKKKEDNIEIYRGVLRNKNWGGEERV